MVAEFAAVYKTAYNTTGPAALAGAVTKDIMEHHARCPSVSVGLDDASHKRAQAIAGVKFMVKGASVHPHPMLAALRELARNDVVRDVLSEGRTKPLFMGAAKMELGIFAKKMPGSAFQMHMSESKDPSRITRHFAELCRARKQKYPNWIPRTGAAPGVDYLEAVRESFGLFSESRHTPDGQERIYFGDEYDGHKCDVMVFMDSMYNFRKEDVSAAMVKTGASSALGYGFYPYELFSRGELPRNELYTYQERGNAAYVVSMEDSSNGYMHLLETWAWPYNCPAWSHTHIVGGKTITEYFTLEIRNRYGPIITFAVNRSSGPSNVVRNMSVPDWMRYVMVLNIPKTGAAARLSGDYRPQYFPVAMREWFTVIHALMRLNEKSISFPNAMVCITRRMGGYAMGSVSEDKWIIPQEHVEALALAAVLQVQMSLANHGSDICASKQIFEDSPFFLYFKAMAGPAVQTVRDFFRWFKSSGLEGNLVMMPEHVKIQEIYGTKITLQETAPESAVNDFVARELKRRRAREAGLTMQVPLLDSLSAGSSSSAKGKADGNSSVGAAMDDSAHQTQSEYGSASSEQEDMQEPETVPEHWKHGAMHVCCSFCAEMRELQLHMPCSSGEHQEWNCSSELQTEKVVEVDDAMASALQADLRRSADESTKTGADHLAVLVNSVADKVPVGGFKVEAVFEHIYAPPGAGKTFFITKLARAGDLIVVPSRELRDQTARMVPASVSVKTQHKAVGTACAGTLYVDEFHCIDGRLLLLIAHLSGCNRVVLVGDSRQTKVRNGVEGLHIDYAASPDNNFMQGIRTHTLRYNFRNPLSITGNKFFSEQGYEMLSHRTERGVIRRVSFAEGYNIGSEHQPLFLSERHDAMPAVAKVPTVRANQGATYTNVVLLVPSTQDVAHLASVSGMLNVAFTRHKQELVLAYDDDCPIRPILERLEEGGKIDARELADSFIPLPASVTRAVTAERDPEIEEREAPPDNDAYLHAPDLLCGAAELIPGDTHNNVGAAIGVKGRNLRVDGLNFNLQSDKGNVERVTEKCYRFANVAGFTFCDRPEQVLNCVTRRYNSSRYWDIKDAVQHQVMATEMVEDWFARFSTAPDAYQIGEEQLDCMAREVIDHALDKGWVSQADIDKPLDLAHFTLKTIFKPSSKDLAADDMIKAPQGISAFPPSLNLVQAMAFRMLQHLINLHEEVGGPQMQVVTDFGIPLVEYVRSLAAGVADTCGQSWVITDGTMFDSCQNDFTQLLERTYYERFGVVSKEFLDFHFSIRANWRIEASGGISAKPDTENASGHSATILGNGTVSKLCSNFIVRTRGKRVVTYKGDDFALRATAPLVDTEKQKRLERHMPLRLKVDIGEGGEFCGLMARDQAFTVNVIRRAKKLMGTRLRDWEHAKTLKPAITDFLRDVSALESCGCPVKAANMDMYAITEGQYDIAVSFLQSFTHLSEQQFFSACEVSYSGTVVVGADGVPSYFCDENELKRLKVELDKAAAATFRPSTKLKYGLEDGPEPREKVSKWLDTASTSSPRSSWF